MRILKVNKFSLLLLLAPALFGFTLSGTDSNLKGWQDDVIKFKINRTNCRSDIDDIVNAAFKVLSSVPTSRLKLKLEGTSTATPAQLYANSVSETPVIACDTDMSTTFSDPEMNNTTGGVGFIFNSQPITAGHLVLNASSGLASMNTINAAAAEVLVAHEIGHVLGLGHSEDVNALMYYSYLPNDKLALAQDDMDGLTYLYPRDEPSDDIFGGCGLVSNVLPPPPPSSGWLILALLIPLATLTGLKLRLKKQPLMHAR